MQPNPSQFSSPSSGDICKPLDVVGHLLLVRPVEFLPEFQTSNGAVDAVRLDICDLSANDEQGNWGAVYRDALWFGRVLVSGLRRQIGETVLARMAQGVAKPGQSPPFNLIDMVPDAQAVAAAQQWLGLHPEFTGGQTSAPPAPAYQPPPTPPASIPPPPAPTSYWPLPIPAAAPITTTPYGPSPIAAPTPGAAPSYGPSPVAPPAPVAAPSYGPSPAYATTPVNAAPYGPPSPMPHATSVTPPSYGPVPIAGATQAATTQPSGAPAPIDPNVDPFSQLTDDQRAALAALGFPR